MNTLYITNTGTVMLDENNKPGSFESTREGISRIFYLKEDTKIYVNREGQEQELDAKAGDLVISFYESEFPHKIIVINSDEWKENLEAYEAAMQKRKEEWAKEKCGECPCECDCTCSNA